MNLAVRMVAQGLLIAGAVGIVIVSTRLSDQVTVRAIHQPAAPYVLPYDTHGGTVFISRTEQIEQRLSWAAGAGLLACQWLLTRADRRSARKRPTIR